MICLFKTVIKSLLEPVEVLNYLNSIKLLSLKMHLHLYKKYYIASSVNL